MSTTRLPSQTTGSKPFSIITTTVCSGGLGSANDNQALASLRENMANDNKVLPSLREGSMDVFVPPEAQQQHCEIVTSTLFQASGLTPTPA
jgi:hypothetical protein